MKICEPGTTEIDDFKHFTTSLCWENAAGSHVITVKLQRSSQLASNAFGTSFPELLAARNASLLLELLVYTVPQNSKETWGKSWSVRVGACLQKDTFSSIDRNGLFHNSPWCKKKWTLVPRRQWLERFLNYEVGYHHNFISMLLTWMFKKEFIPALSSTDKLHFQGMQAATINSCTQIFKPL